MNEFDVAVMKKLLENIAKPFRLTVFDQGGE
jgi:hypothetical protein